MLIKIAYAGICHSDIHVLAAEPLEGRARQAGRDYRFVIDVSTF